MWNGVIMKAPLLISGLILLSGLTAPAQITSAGALTKRVVPPSESGRPGGPVHRAAPTPGAPQAPAIDPAKVQEGKDEVEKSRLEFQKKKAEAGSPFAQYDMGIRYLTGDGVEKNVDTAKKLLASSSKGGNSAATKKLEELKKAEADK